MGLGVCRCGLDLGCAEVWVLDPMVELRIGELDELAVKMWPELELHSEVSSALVVVGGGNVPEVLVAELCNLMRTVVDRVPVIAVVDSTSF